MPLLKGLKLLWILREATILKTQPFKPPSPKRIIPFIREFEIRELGREELKEKERTRDASRHGAKRNS
jgi:hypothetical protein